MKISKIILDKDIKEWYIIDMRNNTHRTLKGVVKGFADIIGKYILIVAK